MLQPGGFEVAQNLSLMFGRDGFGCFEFDDQPAINQQIGEVITNQGAILIIDFDRVLLLDFQTGFPQPMCQRILVNLFQVPMPMVGMDVIGGLSYEVAMKR